MFIFDTDKTLCSRWHMIRTLWYVYKGWRQAPRERLGQWLVNDVLLDRDVRVRRTTWTNPRALFYMEDKEWKEWKS